MASWVPLLVASPGSDFLALLSSRKTCEAFISRFKYIFASTIYHMFLMLQSEFVPTIAKHHNTL
jgi:hypothetical protein